MRLCREFGTDLPEKHVWFSASSRWLLGPILRSAVLSSHLGTWYPRHIIPPSWTGRLCSLRSLLALRLVLGSAAHLFPHTGRHSRGSFNSWPVCRRANKPLSLTLTSTQHGSPRLYIFLEVLCWGFNFPVFGHPSSVLHVWDSRGTGNIPGETYWTGLRRQGSTHYYRGLSSNMGLVKKKVSVCLKAMLSERSSLGTQSTRNIDNIRDSYEIIFADQVLKGKRVFKRSRSSGNWEEYVLVALNLDRLASMFWIVLFEIV